MDPERTQSHGTGSIRSSSSRRSQSRSSSGFYDSESPPGRNSERLQVICTELRFQLESYIKKLEIKEKRASEAERELQQAAAHLRQMNEARLSAQKEAAKANEELRLYKVQYREAQNEILRAQDAVRTIDRQRRNAEREAMEARTMARKLNQEMMLRAAMEEGRKLGLQEGLRRGRELARQEAELMGHSAGMEEEYGEYDIDEESGSSGVDDPQQRLGSILERPPSRDVPVHEATRVQAETAPGIRIPSTVLEETSPALAILPTLLDPPVRDPTPRIIHNASPSISHAHFTIPPDGFIPDLDKDSIIRIPPPHELSVSPALPVQRLEDSTPSLMGRRSPLLTTSEIPTAQAAPNSVPPPEMELKRPLGRHPWRSGASDVYARPRSSSSSSGGHHKVQPRRSIDDTARYTTYAQSDTGLPIPPPFANMPGGSHASPTANALETEDRHSTSTPVIPHPTLFQHDPKNDSSDSSGSRDTVE